MDWNDTNGEPIEWNGRSRSLTMLLLAPLPLDRVGDLCRIVGHNGSHPTVDSIRIYVSATEGCDVTLFLTVEMSFSN